MIDDAKPSDELIRHANDLIREGEALIREAEEHMRTHPPIRKNPPTRSDKPEEDVYPYMPLFDAIAAATTAHMHDETISIGVNVDKFIEVLRTHRDAGLVMECLEVCRPEGTKKAGPPRMFPVVEDGHVEWLHAEGYADPLDRLKAVASLKVGDTFDKVGLPISDWGPPLTGIIKAGITEIERARLALGRIADMDPRGVRTDDLGRAAGIARDAIVKLTKGPNPPDTSTPMTIEKPVNVARDGGTGGTRPGAGDEEVTVAMLDAGLKAYWKHGATHTGMREIYRAMRRVRPDQVPAYGY